MEQLHTDSCFLNLYQGFHPYADRQGHFQVFYIGIRNAFNLAEGWYWRDEKLKLAESSESLISRQQGPFGSSTDALRDANPTFDPSYLGKAIL